MPTTEVTPLTISKSTVLNDTVNDTTQSLWPPLTLKDYILVFAFGLICTLGVLGNALVIYVFGFRKNRTRHRSTTEWLILYLGIVDFLASLINPPLYIFWTVTHFSIWPFGAAACKFLPAFGQITITASSGILLILAMDRYCAIVMPFRGEFSFRTATIATVVNIVICFLIYAHYMHTLVIEKSGKCIIPDISVYSYSIPNCLFIILRLMIFACVFIFTNAMIFTTLRRQREELTIKELKVKRHREAQKIMRVLLVMGIVFVVMVFPRELFYLVYNISWIDSENGLNNPIAFRVNSWLKVMHTANSCANVFIYANMHDVYREHVMRLFKCCRHQRPENIFTLETQLIDDDHCTYITESNTSTFFKRAKEWRECTNSRRV